MQTDLQVLLITAITISFVHTLAGPDHYLPLIALSKSRRWSLSRTIFWTVVCGSGHVLSSIVLGLVGAALGWSFSKSSAFETNRGAWAGWLLLGCGAMYTIWGLLRTWQNRPHRHFDVYGNGSVYMYEHKHSTAVAPDRRYPVTPWVLFLIFILGPCEPMLPLLFFPAATHSVMNMVLLICVYTLFTLATMVVLVVLSFFSVSILKMEKLERHMHTLAGLAILMCGIGVLFLNW